METVISVVAFFVFLGAIASVLSLILFLPAIFWLAHRSENGYNNVKCEDRSTKEDPHDHTN